MYSFWAGAVRLLLIKLVHDRWRQSFITG